MAAKNQSQQTSGSTSSSQQGSTAQSLGLSGQQSFVDPSQVPFLNFLRQQGQGVAQQQIGSIGGVANQLSGQLGGVGGQLLGGLQQGAQAFAPGAQSSIAQLLGITQGQDASALRGAATGPLAGQGQLAQLAAGGGGLAPGGQLDFQGLLEPGQQIGGQLGALDTAIQRNLASTLGTLGGQATLAGQTGGDRQAFLSSEAAGRAQEQFAGGAAGILAGDLASRRQLAPVASQLALGQQGIQQQGILGGLQNQLGAAQSLQGGALGQAGLLSQLLGTGVAGAQGAGQIGLGQQQQQFGAAQAGLGQLGNLFNLGLSPFSAQFQPLQQLAQLLGGPTVLQQGFGIDQSQSQSFGQSRGSSFGQGTASGFSLGPQSVSLGLGV